MSEEGEGIVRRVDDYLFTEEALKMNDGKEVPLRLEQGGPVIGKATLKYDPDEKALKAEFEVTDPKVAEFLKGHPPNIFE